MKTTIYFQHDKKQFKAVVDPLKYGWTGLTVTRLWSGAVISSMIHVPAWLDLTNVSHELRDFIKQSAIARNGDYDHL